MDVVCAPSVVTRDQSVESNNTIVIGYLNASKESGVDVGAIVRVAIAAG